MWNQAHWFDRSLKTFLSRRRVDPRESFQRAVIALPSTRNFSFQYIPLGRTRAEFSSQSLWCSIYHVHEICSNFHATPRNFEKRPSLRVYAFSKVFKCVGLKDSFMIIKWNISLWLDWEQHGLVKQHDVASPRHAVHHLKVGLHFLIWRQR